MYCSVEKQDLAENVRQNVKHQLRPHFLFNELAAIRYMIRKNPELAYDMVYDFSKYLRGNIESLVDGNEIELEQEMEQIKAYLNLEKVRLKGKLVVVYEVSHNFMIPPRVIELLVESVVKHSISTRQEGGTLWIRSICTAAGYEVLVEDNGIGLDEETLKEKESDNYGYIQRQLESISGASMQIESVLGQGTKARVSFNRGDEDESHCSR